MAQWQPIKTAPTDGTFFRGGWYSQGSATDKLIWRTGIFHAVRRGWLRARYEIIELGDHYRDHIPTHWQPLPPPPENEK